MATKKPRTPERASSSLPSFAAKLRAARILAGYVTAAEFASALEIEAETYRRYERGETDPSLANLVKIAELTKQPYSLLLASQDVMPILRTDPVGPRASSADKTRTKRTQ